MIDLPSWASVAPEVLTYIVGGPFLLLSAVLAISFAIGIPASLFWFAIRGIAPTQVGSEPIGLVWRLVAGALGVLALWAIWIVPWL